MEITHDHEISVVPPVCTHEKARLEAVHTSPKNGNTVTEFEVVCQICKARAWFFSQRGPVQKVSIPWTFNTELVKGQEASKVIEERMKSELGDGPGTDMAISFFRQGVPSCQACKALAKKMNHWGPQGCRTHMDEIVNDMLPRARDWVAKKRPWANKVLNVLKVVGADDAAAKVAIRSTVNEMLDAYEARKGN